MHTRTPTPTPAARGGKLALLLLAFSYSTFGVTARLLAEHFEIYQQIYLRTLVALVLLTAVYALSPRPRIRIPWRQIPARDWLLLIVRVAAIGPISIGLFTKAVMLTSLGNTALIAALPFAAIWGALLFRERLRPSAIGLLILGFAGVFLIAVRDPADLFSWGEGELLALASTIFFTLGLVTRRWHTPLLGNRDLALVFLLCATPMLILVSLLVGEGVPRQFGLETAAVVAIAGGFSALSVYLGNLGFEAVPSFQAGNILTLECVFALLLGYMFYGEVPTLRTLGGGFLVILSVILLNRSRR